MSAGDDIGERLREAACVGDLALLTKLESQGVDLNSKNSMNGWTALHWACKRNHVAVVSHLLERGVDSSITNKDGLIPAQLASNEEIRKMLGATSVGEIKSAPLPITPNYLAHPPFPYAGSEKEHQQSKFASYAANNGNQGLSRATSDNYNGVVDELVLKARLANSDERDFIEIELPHTHLNYSGLLNLMCAELKVDNKLVAKIRKLPDTIVRKDKDVRRLKDFQELELVLTNKALSASSRTYSLGPAKNEETILY